MLPPAVHGCFRQKGLTQAAEQHRAAADARDGNGGNGRTPLKGQRQRPEHVQQ